MNTRILLCASTLATLTLAAIAAPKDDVIAAAKKLADEPNYSWKSTVSVPANAQMRPGPTEGQTEKDGYMSVTWSFGDNTTHAIMKGDKGALTNQDGDWDSVADVEKEEGFGRFRAIMARNLKAPAAQAIELAEGAKDLKQEGDTISGDLTDDAAKNLLRFGRRAGGDGPSVSGAKGSVKFWIKDGALTRYEYKAAGTVSFNGNDREVDRTTKVEIKDVGKTKVNVPEAAKKKMS